MHRTKQDAKVEASMMRMRHRLPAHLWCTEFWQELGGGWRFCYRRRQSSSKIAERRIPRRLVVYPVLHPSSGKLLVWRAAIAHPHAIAAFCPEFLATSQEGPRQAVRNLLDSAHRYLAAMDQMHLEAIEDAQTLLLQPDKL